ncbi:MAG: right-handed parallel beta-helix repeat-containing protein, partial [Clostridia bacterium]|nr:right-handed parallel beta-helix repeat-containing protein [Clostridia bacterium]
SSGYAASATSWQHRLRYGSTVTIEKGKTYQMSVKLKSTSSVAANVTLQGIILNVRPAAYAGYTLVTPSKSYQDTPIYMEGKSKYSAAGSQWQTSQTGTVTVEDILDASGTSVTSMQVTPQMYFKTGQAASLGFYIEELSFEEVPAGEEVDEFESLDLSGTEKTILAPEETTQISVKGVNGETATELTEGVTFSSSNSRVASVNENGLVTANQGGTAVITASYGDVSKSVMIVVGQVQRNIGYENDSDWTDTEIAKVVTDQVRSGAKALWLNTRNSSTTDRLNTSLNLSGTNSSQGAVQLWFYDDLVTAKDAFFWYLGDKNTETNNQISSYIRFFNTEYAYRGSTFSDDQETSALPRSLGWHQLVISWDIAKIHFSIDGQEFASGTKPIEQPITELYLSRLAKCSEQSIWVDDLVSVSTALPSAPVVDSLTIEGAYMIGEELTANESISDANGDPLDTPLYQWESSPDQSVWTEIEGATQKTYTPVEEDLGKYLRVGVTPRSTVEPKIGTKVYAQTGSKISIKKNPPSATEVSITGKAGVGNILTAEYTYVPSQGGDDEGESLFVWETGVGEDGPFTPVQSSAKKTYAVAMADAGKYIRVKVIPKDINGLSGTGIYSQAIRIGQGAVYYVATDGSDDNSGSIDAPFATIEKARDMIAAGELPEGGATVYIRGGTYPVSNTISFTSQHSGQADKPIVYQAYPGEEVSFVGGKTLDTSKMKKVTDEALLNRLVDQNAKEHLMSINLGEQGVEMTPLEPYGWGFSSYNPTEIYMNGTKLKEARWPNDDKSQNLIQTTPIMESDKKYNYAKQPIKLSYPDAENRSSKWTVKRGDAYVGGAIVALWATCDLRIDQLDAANKVVTTIDPSSYSLEPGAGWGQQYKIYFSNIFEEIDQPGESYLDRSSNILYFYPVGDTKNANMVVSTLNKTMLDISEASYLTFRGIHFKDSRSTLVSMSNVTNVRIEDGEISGSSQAGISMKNAKNSTITGCHIYNMAGSAIQLSGGDRANLTPSGNLIENNYFHNCSQRSGSYESRYVINISGCVGEVIRHNEFDDLMRGAIGLQSSNDIIIEYNRITNSVQFVTDYGAIYWG